MIILNNEEQKEIVGGINISGTLISALSKAINSLMDVGRSLGTSIRMIKYKMICPL